MALYNKRRMHWLFPFCAHVNQTGSTDRVHCCTQLRSARQLEERWMISNKSTQTSETSCHGFRESPLVNSFFKKSKFSLLCLVFLLLFFLNQDKETNLSVFFFSSSSARSVCCRRSVKISSSWVSLYSSRNCSPSSTRSRVASCSGMSLR